MIGVCQCSFFLKDCYVLHLSRCDCEFNKVCKTHEYLDTKTCLWQKRLFHKLILWCEDEMLHTTETLLVDK